PGSPRRRLGGGARRRRRGPGVAALPPAIRRPDREEGLMAPITATTEIARAPQEVFAYVTDPTRFVEWQHGVVSGRTDGEGPHAVGETCLTTRRIGGANRQSTSEITHIDPPTTAAVRGIERPIPTTDD